MLTLFYRVALFIPYYKGMNVCQYNDYNCDRLLFLQLNENFLLIQLPFDSLDWVVYLIRGIEFLFGC